MASQDLKTAVARFSALLEALETRPSIGGPRHVRQCAAMVALSASDPVPLVAERAKACAKGLLWKRGVAAATRPIFATALAVAGRSGEDYGAARENLLPAMEGVRRMSLPAAALAYAMAGRTSLTESHLERVRALAPIVGAPWWSEQSAWNGFFAAALALRPEGVGALEARVGRAARALADVDAPRGVQRTEARRLALADVDPHAAARAWKQLEAERRSRGWGRLPPSVLVGYAARAGDRATEAVGLFDEALTFTRNVRPRVIRNVRPFLTAGLAGHALSPQHAAQDPSGAMSALQAAMVVAEAQAATVAVVAASAVAVSAG